MVFGEVHQHEPAAADIAGAGQGDSQRKADGDGGIDSIAAPFENVQADLAGGGLLRDHHTVLSDHGKDAGRAGRIGLGQALAKAGRNQSARDEARADAGNTREARQALKRYGLPVFHGLFLTRYLPD